MQEVPGGETEAHTRGSVEECGDTTSEGVVLRRRHRKQSQERPKQEATEVPLCTPHTPATGLEQGRSRAVTAGPAHSGCQVALLLAAGPLGQRARGFWLLWSGGRFRRFQDLFPVTSIPWPVLVNLAWGGEAPRLGC